MKWFLFIGYLIMVFGITLFNRGAKTYEDSNFYFLSSYRIAWNSFSNEYWTYIILNIFMLIPLGIFLPLLDKRFHKLGWTFGVALLLSSTIETIQLATNYGIFETDDIFNNVLGAIIGYGIIMSIIIVMEDRENKLKRIIIYLLPSILVLSSFIIILKAYNSQEFGNLDIDHDHKVNIKKRELILDTEINNDGKEVFLNADTKYNIGKVLIYKAPSYDKDTGENFFKG